MAFPSLFVSDLHGHISRYEKLFATIMAAPPAFVFMGGDLLPHGLKKMDGFEDFTMDFLFPGLRRLKQSLKDAYPGIFVIPGNDDCRSEEIKFREAAAEGLLFYLNNSMHEGAGIKVFGYPFIPPTPFHLKDWEKYDVSRYVDPGCIHPSEGFRSIKPDYDTEYATIANDLDALTRNHDLSKAVMLFHSPPYKTNLDRASLDGMWIDHVPLDVHIGSIAILRLIERKQPLVTLHGHVHESTRITGQWRETMNKTMAFNAAHDGKELCLIKFRDILEPGDAERILL